MRKKCEKSAKKVPESGRMQKLGSPLVFKSFNTRLLKVSLNGHNLIMMQISSGMHHSVINTHVWEQLGKPPLEPAADRFSASGVQFPIKGLFIAKVRIGRRSFSSLPILVSDLADTRSLIGRSWFPALHLDWTGIFSDKGTSNPFQRPSKIQQKLAMEMTKQTNYFYVLLKIEGRELKMALDTGSKDSKIDYNKWKSLGEPPLKQKSSSCLANKNIPCEGQFDVKVEYKDTTIDCLPLVVTSSPTGVAVIGNSWFSEIPFNFNAIFENVTFSKLEAKEDDEKTIKTELNDSDLCVICKSIQNNQISANANNDNET